MKFSENLKRFRKSFDLSQVKLAKMLGISRGQIANYETSISEPSLTTIQKIADFFHVPIESMLDDKPIFLEKPIGKIFIKSNFLMTDDSKGFIGLEQLYELNYRFGAFYSDGNEIIEFIYLGSCKHPLIDYLLNQSHSYDVFNEFIKVIYAQIGWKFIDKANTKTYIVVNHPDAPEAFYHIYGNYMSGMKMSRIYNEDFLSAINKILTLERDELKDMLYKFYKNNTVKKSGGKR
ncbi:helix-turn-helix transcriptional regulator [Veillonella montpellierensis]|uniref:helix-turn-helix transcriptional regulator n=1 Tax=Veillonella montpellierensis TaxID=187328 RepID=UPI000691501F|nr:helix-turn-helix transcriptional regulator [Veillonella montpellierensis]